MNLIFAKNSGSISKSIQNPLQNSQPDCSVDEDYQILLPVEYNAREEAVVNNNTRNKVTCDVYSFKKFVMNDKQ